MEIKTTKNKTQNKTNNNEIETIYCLVKEYKAIYVKDCEIILDKIEKHLSKDKSAIQKEDLLYDISDYELNFLISLSTKKILTLNNSMKKYDKKNLDLLCEVNFQEYYKNEIIKYTNLNKMFLTYILTKENKRTNSNIENCIHKIKSKTIKMRKNKFIKYI